MAERLTDVDRRRAGGGERSGTVLYTSSYCLLYYRDDDVYFLRLQLIVIGGVFLASIPYPQYFRRICHKLLLIYRRKLHLWDIFK